MKNRKYGPGGLKTMKVLPAAFLLAGSLLVSELALATSQGTVLRNSVSVAYDDTGGAAQTPVTATVDVTVDLVPAVVWGTAPSDQTIGSNTALTSGYTLTLTNTVMVVIVMH